MPNHEIPSALKDFATRFIIKTIPDPCHSQANIIKRLCFVENATDINTGQCCQTTASYSLKNGKFVRCFFDVSETGPYGAKCKPTYYEYYEETVVGFLEKDYSVEQIAKKLNVARNDALYEEIKKVAMYRPKHQLIHDKVGVPASYKPGVSPNFANLTRQQKEELIDTMGVTLLSAGKDYTHVIVTLGINNKDECFHYFIAMVEKHILERVLEDKSGEYSPEKYSEDAWDLYTELNSNLIKEIKPLNKLKYSMMELFVRNIEHQRSLKNENDAGRPHPG